MRVEVPDSARGADRVSIRRGVKPPVEEEDGFVFVEPEDEEDAHRLMDNWENSLGVEYGEDGRLGGGADPEPGPETGAPDGPEDGEESEGETIGLESAGRDELKEVYRGLGGKEADPGSDGVNLNRSDDIRAGIERLREE